MFNFRPKFRALYGTAAVSIIHLSERTKRPIKQSQREGGENSEKWGLWPQHVMGIIKTGREGDPSQCGVRLGGMATRRTRNLSRDTKRGRGKEKATTRRSMPSHLSDIDIRGRSYPYIHNPFPFCTQRREKEDDWFQSPVLKVYTLKIEILPIWISWSNRKCVWKNENVLWATNEHIHMLQRS